MEEEKSRGRREDLASLACRVEGSAVGARIEERARGLITAKGLLAKSIDIHAPNGDDLAAMERDGLNLPSYIVPSRGSGHTAAMAEFAVGWHLGRIRPSRWQAWLRMKPSDIVAGLLGVNRIGNMLANALRGAVITHGDTAFAQAILEASPSAGQGWIAHGLWRLIPPDSHERLMVRLVFDKSQRDWTVLTSMDEALAAAPRPWSSSLVTLVRHEIGRSFATKSDVEVAFARNRLGMIATHAPPASLVEMEARITELLTQLDNPGTFDTVLEIIAARRALDAAFTR
jgi:hypothetical protein